MNNMPGIIDIHTHILPGIDDGARDMQESMAMLQSAAKQGITAVIATPHYSMEGTELRIEEGVAELQREVDRQLPGFCVYSGQELMYHESLTERLKSGLGYPLAGSRYVLVEFEVLVPYQTLYRGVRNLLAAGYIPVLAHVERYACLRKERMIGDLCGSGCWLQMNYESLQGHWFHPDVRWCRKQVSEGRIHLLATDMHRTDWRPPDITGAFAWLEKHVSREHLERMVYGNPLRIIESGLPG